MPLILSDLRMAVRSETGNTEDDQYTDTELGVWYWIEYGKLHRKLAASFPELFKTTSSETVLTAGGTNLINKPADYTGLIRLERLSGEQWQSVPMSSPVNPDLDSYIGYEEFGATFALTPTNACAGTYRLVYLYTPSETFPADDVPRGIEDVLIQKVIAKAQIRVGGDPAPHVQEAKDTYKEVTKALKSMRRKTRGPEPGLVCGYGAGTSYGQDWTGE